MHAQLCTGRRNSKCICTKRCYCADYNCHLLPISRQIQVVTQHNLLLIRWVEGQGSGLFSTNCREVRDDEETVIPIDCSLNEFHVPQNDG